jgi:cytoskeleton protein RodZ
MPDKPAQDESPQPKPIGDRLRDAREASGIPLEKIAGDLLLDPSVLEHLEAEEFTALGAPVFVRGHLRKYAMRLGLPGDELVEIYHRDHDRPQGLPIINESLAFKDKNRRGWILLLALLVIAAASVAFVVLKDGRDKQAPPPANPAEKKEEAVLETTPLVAESLVASADDNAASQTIPRPPVAGLETEPSPEPAPGVDGAPLPEASPSRAASTPVQARTLDVSFSFDEDSWVEVYDATGARLLYAMGRAGSTRRVSGEPPLRVFLGLARAVDVRVGGETFVVPQERIRRDVARFVIGDEAIGVAASGEMP